MVFKVDVYLFRLFLFSFLKVRQGQWEQRKQGGRAQQVGPLICSESCRNHLVAKPEEDTSKAYLRESAGPSRQGLCSKCSALPNSRCISHQMADTLVEHASIY